MFSRLADVRLSSSIRKPQPIKVEAFAFVILSSNDLILAAYLDGDREADHLYVVSSNTKLLYTTDILPTY